MCAMIACEYEYMCVCLSQALLNREHVNVWKK